ncbi:MAG: hypothetical protein AAB352_03200 [Patescibacteria group bacterium]
MPFQSGHKLSVGNKGGGRKGFSIEQKQLNKMRRLLDRYILLAEKNQLTIEERERFQRLEKFSLKILDKMFANKLAIKEEIETPIMII